MNKLITVVLAMFVAACDPNANSAMKSYQDSVYLIPCGQKMISADYTSRYGMRVVTRKMKDKDKPQEFILYVHHSEGGGDRTIKECK